MCTIGVAWMRGYSYSVQYNNNTRDVRILVSALGQTLDDVFRLKIVWQNLWKTSVIFLSRRVVCCINLRVDETTVHQNPQRWKSIYSLEIVGL